MTAHTVRLGLTHLNLGLGCWCCRCFCSVLVWVFLFFFLKGRHEVAVMWVFICSHKTELAYFSPLIFEEVR